MTLADDGMKVGPVPRLRTLVAERIREGIATNRFPPGTRLVERELCEMLGVSRTSIREALRELESEGLISTQGGRPVVAVLTLPEIRDIYQVRTVLEELAARLFVRNATPEQFERLSTSAEALLQVYENYAPAPFLAAKARFYEALFEGAGNQVAASMLRIIHTKASQLRATSLSVPDRIQASIGEIRGLVAAVEARDEDLAARLSARHIENACRAAMTVYEESAPGGCRASREVN
ncbi:MAG TPA: GntR family transcriptional regulator [Sphingomonadaceae bacterium]|jgi:DNA-binding GntR family transcriptional regulator|nr:GntR family transcriptional regulator [Sphingomonadaceae bacterium]